MAFCWAEDERPVPAGLGKGEGEGGWGWWKGDHPPTSVWWSQCCSRKLLCVRHGVPAFPQVFTFWVCLMSPGFLVHPLECRALNLLLSLCPSDLHCPRSPALSLIGTWSVLSWGCNPSIALEGNQSCELLLEAGWQGLCNHILAELCVGQRHSVLWMCSR